MALVKTATVPELGDFRLETKHTETAYTKALSLPLQRCLLIIPEKPKRRRWYLALMRNLIGSGVKLVVACAEGAEVKLPFIRSVVTNGDEYFECLATAQFVYTETVLYKYFAPRDGQTVFGSHLPKRKGQPAVKASRHMTRLKCDYIIGGKSSKAITKADFINHVSGRSSLAPKQNDSTIKLLYIVAPKTVGYVASRANRILSWVGSDKIEITLLMGSDCTVHNADVLRKLNSSIRLVEKAGKPLCDAEERRRYEYMALYHRDFDEKVNFEKILPKSFFAREQRRLVGKEKYDLVCNFTRSSGIYWLALAGLMDCRRAIYLGNNYENPLTNNQLWTLRLRKWYDVALFGNIDNKLSEREIPDGYAYGPSQVLQHVPRKSLDDVSSAIPIVVGEERCLCCTVRPQWPFDSVELGTVPFFEEGTCTYLVVDSSKNSEVWYQTIDLMRMYYKIDCVFDFGDMLTENRLGLPIIHDLDLYYAVLRRFATCLFVEGTSAAYYQEALLAGVDVVYVGAEGVTKPVPDMSAYSPGDAFLAQID